MSEDTGISDLHSVKIKAFPLERRIERLRFFFPIRSIYT